MKLTPKQALFVAEYVKDFNGTQAAIRAGYSKKTAAEIASENLTKPHIAAAILEASKQHAEAVRLSAKEAWQELRCLAKSDIGEIFDFSGDVVRMKPANQIPEHARRAIKSMKTKRYTEGHGDDAKEVEVVEFQFWDKPGQIIVALKAIGELKDKVEHTGADGKPIEVKHHGATEVLEALTALESAINAGADQGSHEAGIPGDDSGKPVHPEDPPAV